MNLSGRGNPVPQFEARDAGEFPRVCRDEFCWDCQDMGSKTSDSSTKSAGAFTDLMVRAGSPNPPTSLDGRLGEAFASLRSPLRCCLRQAVSLRSALPSG